MEPLESRAMLAITLPPSGDMLAAPVGLATDAVVEANNLTIVYDDTSHPGVVTATITATSPSTGSVSRVYWNFSQINFTGSMDTDGLIVNSVELQTPYQADVVGFGASGFGVPLSVTNWQVDASFAASPYSPGLAFLDLLNADALAVTCGGSGSASTTVAGEFQSPTDLLVPGATGSEISVVDSGLGLTDKSNIGIEAYAISLKSTNGGVDIAADLEAVVDIVVSGNSGSLLLGDSGGAMTSVSSQRGDITLSNAAGPVSIANVNVSALNGGISVSTSSTLVVSGSTSFTAPAAYASASPEVPDGLVRLVGGLALTLPSIMPVTSSRLELATSGVAPIALSQLAVGSMKAAIGGSLDLVNSKPLVISNFSNATTAEIVAQSLSIRSPSGIRVVDGISTPGAITLSTFVSGTGTTPTIPVDFVVTGDGDNPLAADPFGGTLRDMVEYVNRNALDPLAQAASVSRQPMRVLFDEAGSPVATGGVVTLAAALPAVQKPVTLDGSLAVPTPTTSLDLGGIVGIDGGGVAATGLVLGAAASGSVLRDAAFYGFIGSGVRVESADNLLTGLTVGADRNRAVVEGNVVGIELIGVAATRNVVGVGTIGVDSGNYIVGNTRAGIVIRGRAASNAVYGNTIGVAGAGNADGIQIINSLGTIVGGTRAGLANTVAGNSGNGIRLTNVSAVSVPYGAKITGNVLADNGAAGVLIEGGSRNLVGGVGPDEGNAIAGNTIGVRMGSSGTVRTQGNQVFGNTISDSREGGVLIEQGYANLVQGNTVTDTELRSKWGVRVFSAPQGTGLAPNRLYQNTVSGSGDRPLNGGIVVENSSGQVVGGPGTLGNIVVDNGGSGIVIVGGTGVSAATANTLEGNLVGTTASGEIRGNSFDGIRVQGSVANVVRGNTVSNHGLAENQAAGIGVYDALATGASKGNSIVLNTVADNHVGIRVSGGAHTAIGGRIAGLGNWVYRNTADGIRVDRSNATGDATSTVIKGNRIGLATGPQAASNGGYGINLLSTVGTTVDQGNIVAFNSSGGIRIEGGRSGVIGSTTAGLGNVIRDNAGNGVEIVQPAAPGRTEAVLIAGNTIRGNSDNGISVADTAAAEATAARVSGITIGRAVSVNRPDASSNRIVNNGFAGVLVDGAQAVSIVGNAIVGNRGPLQIELENDANAVLSPAPATTVVAPAILQANPRVAGQVSPQYDVSGTVSRTGTGTAAQTVLVDIYGTNTATNDQFFLGRVTVKIRANAAAANFRVIVAGAGNRFDRIVATSTLGFNTSEFSNAVGV
jgi:parallel beta-helix repeat protein